MVKNATLLENVLNCDLCKYYTCNKRDYARHIKTKRHLTRMEEFEEISSSVPPHVGRSYAQDECDDYIPIIPDSAGEWIVDTPFPSPSTPLHDSFIRDEKNKKPTNRSKKGSTTTSYSPDNVVIRKIEANTLSVDEEHDISSMSGESRSGSCSSMDSVLSDNREPIYESIYTNPVVVYDHVPGVFEYIYYLGALAFNMLTDILFETPTIKTPVDR